MPVETDIEVRNRLEGISIEDRRKMLEDVDPLSCEKIHANDVRRTLVRQEDKCMLLSHEK